MSTQELKPDQLELSSSSRPATESGDRYFESLEQSQRLDLLRYLVENSDRIPLVQAPAGAGKTTLMRRFAGHPRGHWKLVQVTADPLLQPDRLLTAVAKGLDCDETAEGAGLLEGLILRLQELQARDILVILLLDDAHLLPEASIIALLRLFERAQEAPGSFRLVLFAEDVFQRLLQAPQIQAMNLQHLQQLDLPGLDAQHCRAFIEFLLQREQLAGRINAKDRRFELICREAAGLPGQVEARVLQLLKESSIAPASKRQLTADLPGVALIGGGLVVVLILLTLLFQDEINRLFEATPEEGLKRMAPVAQEAVIPLSIPSHEATAVDRENATDRPPQETGEADGTKDRVAQPTVDLPQLTPQVPVTETGGGTAPEETKAIVAGVQDEVSQEDPAAGVAEANRSGNDGSSAQHSVSASGVDAGLTVALNGGEVFSGEDRVSVSRSSRLPVRDPGEPSELLQSQARSDSSAVAVTQQPRETSRGQQPAVAPAEGSMPTTEVGDWILSQPRSGYSLQLIALQQEAAARQFISAHHLAGKAYYFRSLRDGKPWFAVLYGVYPSRAAALAAKAELPPALRRRDAWPRSLASLQDLVRQR